MYRDREPERLRGRLAATLQAQSREWQGFAWEKCDRYPYRDFTFHVWLLKLARKELEDRGLYERRETWLENFL